MSEQVNNFRTGERVQETGEYVSHKGKGERQDLHEDEIFPHCPKTGQQTVWIRGV